MKVKSVLVIDWELFGKLIEKEKINISPSVSRWSAFYTGFDVNDQKIVYYGIFLSCAQTLKRSERIAHSC